MKELEKLAPSSFSFSLSSLPSFSSLDLFLLAQGTLFKDSLLAFIMFLLP